MQKVSLPTKMAHINKIAPQYEILDVCKEWHILHKDIPFFNGISFKIYGKNNKGKEIKTPYT